ncbi:MAG TPA: hypothetical protein VIE65_06515, partial [Methylobacter sp.]
SCSRTNSRSIHFFISLFVYAFTRNRQKEIHDIRRRIEDQTPLTIEESRKIRSDAIRKEDEHSQET